MRWLSDFIDIDKCTEFLCTAIIVCSICTAICYSALQIRLYSLARLQLRLEAVKSVMQADLGSSEGRAYLLEKAIGHYGL